MLAVVRKLILLEVEAASGMFLIGTAGAILALGIVFVLIHFVERQEPGSDLPSPGAEEEPNEGRQRKSGRPV